MSALTTPSNDLARRILGDVAWDDALLGHTLQGPGSASYSFTNVEHVAQFIGMSTLDVEPEDLFLRGADIRACYVKPEALQEWVGTVVGDPELAAAIGDVIAADNGVDSYPVAMQPILQLVRERADQARAVLGITEETVGAEVAPSGEARPGETAE